MTEETQVAEQTAEPQTNSSKVELNNFYGLKAGMTRIFDESGNHVPVTVIKLVPNFITQVRTVEKDGYKAVQLGYNEKREKLVTKPIKGHLAKAKVKLLLTRFAEVRTEDASEDSLGKEVAITKFTPNTIIDVTGTSKGKGFQGVIKRWNFACGPMAHGSKFHRTGGSIGNRATPGRVWKNKKMPGHMGAERKTVQNLMVVEVNEEKGYMLIKGSVPGSKNSYVRISTAIKK